MMIDGSDTLSATKQAELRGVISTKPGLNRYVRVIPGSLLRTDAAKIKAEENLDGKYLLRTSDPQLPAEDIALGYKQLLEVERGWPDLKHIIDLRPRHLVLAGPAADPDRLGHRQPGPPGHRGIPAPGPSRARHDLSEGHPRLPRLPQPGRRRPATRPVPVTNSS
jgi:hypothetical protein